MEQELEQRMEQLPSLCVINDRLSTFLTPHESKVAFVKRSLGVLQSKVALWAW